MTDNCAESILACRSCGSRTLSLVLDLGNQPIANALLERGDLSAEEPRFPLELLVCDDCSLAQVSQTIDPAVLFNEQYPYFSSFLPALLDHSREHAQSLIAELALGADDLVVEIASNDGYLLKNFVEAGIPVLGIDPAAGPVKSAQEIGVRSLKAFFNRQVAEELVADGMRAKVMIANNVLAHVTDINEFVAGFSTLIADDGIIEFEFPYVRKLVENCAFDTIYHEHVFYYSLSALTPLFARHGLHLNDALELSIHGGSLRLRVSKSEGQTPRLAKLLDEERALKLDSVAYYRDFAISVERIRDDLRSTLESYKRDGKRLAAYGAAAKGATLLNFAGLPTGTLDYVVDRNPHKVGRFMPGVHLPIRATTALTDDPPDVLLILTWNFADEIVSQQKQFADQGGLFLCPVPSPHLVAA